MERGHVAYENNEKDYKPMIDIIKEKARDRLDSALHLAARLLNPFYNYVEDEIS